MKIVHVHAILDRADVGAGIEADAIEEYYRTFHHRLPVSLRDELERLRNRLRQPRQKAARE